MINYVNSQPYFLIKLLIEPSPGRLIGFVEMLESEENFDNDFNV